MDDIKKFVTKLNKTKKEEYEAFIRDVVESYEVACEDILQSFCEKHDYVYEEDAWVAGDIGTIALIGDFYVDIQTMIHDLENDIPKDEFIKWYDYSVDCHIYGLKFPNYENWCKGAPRYTPEEIEKVKKVYLQKIFNGIDAISSKEYFKEEKNISQIMKDSTFIKKLTDLITDNINGEKYK